jgi:O-antigen ligase
MIFLPCAVIFDFAKPGEFYPLTSEGAVIGRAAAMFINPTAAGEAILHVFLIGCAVTKMKYRFPLFFLAGAAILTTFSRSSIMAWVLILAILFFKRTMPKSSIIPVAIVLSISLILLGSFESYLLSRQDLDAGASNILARLDFFSSFAFDDDSSEERADVMVAGWELFLQNPITGAGAGATLFWSHRGGTHNQFLLFAAEYGLLGIVLWIWLLAILWNGTFFKDRGLQVAMVFLYVFMSLFTHVMLDSSSYWLATFALISVKGNRAGLPCPDKIRKCD